MFTTIDGAKIVIAEDDFISAKLLEKKLIKYGHRVFVAHDGLRTLELIDEVSPDLVILDIILPSISGLEVCERIRSDERYKFLPIIIITSSKKTEDKFFALSKGVNDFIYKPFDIIDLELRIESLLKFKNAINELANVNSVLIALVKAVEAKDKYIKGHAERVSLFALQIADKFDLSKKQIKDIRISCLLHDIGKIGIPDIILNRKSKLSRAEYEIVKQHSIIGYEICSSIEVFDNVSKIVRHHHEKINGTGYPDGISGNALNIETRIISVADIYDALTSDRSYRNAYSPDRAIAILKEAVERQEVDCQVVKALEEIINYG